MAADENDDALAGFRGDLAVAVAEHGVKELMRLTDEELIVLDPVPTGTLVATPHLDSLPEAQREMAKATAIRTLIAHGTALVTNAEEVREAIRADADQEVAIGLQPTGLVKLVLALRGTAAYLLIAELHAAAGASYAYFYLRGPGPVLREHVSDGGMHSYAAVRPENLAAEIRDFLDPLGVAREDGIPVELTADALETHQAGPLNPVLESALCAGRLILVPADGTAGPMLLTYATSESVWAVQAREPGDALTARAVSAGTLGDMVSEILRLAGATEQPASGSAGEPAREPTVVAANPGPGSI